MKQFLSSTITCRYLKSLELKSIVQPFLTSEVTLLFSITAKKYPIFGTQWHPEKNNFEYNTNEDICHTSTAILMTQYMSNFFVNQARKSQHKFASEERLQELVIYNYSPVYTGKTDGDHQNFEQCYMFD